MLSTASNSTGKIAALAILLAIAFTTEIASARGRMFHPAQARFMQRDPLGTAYQPPMTRNISDARFTKPDSAEQYHDGMSLYQYERSGPVKRRDWAGLDSGCNCGPDVTDWFTEEVNIHSAFWRSREENFGPFMRPLYFKKYAARIPYKWTTFEGDNCPSDGKCSGTVMLCKKCIHKSELGNLMYGAIAKQFLRGELLIIGAARMFGKAGPDSIEDMAGIIGGLSVGNTIRDGSVSSSDLCTLIKTNQSSYISRIQKGFDPETNGTYELLGKLSGDNLSDMGEKYSECGKCPDPGFNMPHSDYSWIRTTKDIASGDWKQTYPGFPTQWPQE